MSIEKREVLISRIIIKHAREAPGIGSARPRISWQSETAVSNWLQAGYELECRNGTGQAPRTTGRVESGESVLVAWPFEPLGSREAVALRVRVWGRDGSSSPWSEPIRAEAGLLCPEDWRAAFISPDWDGERSKSNPAPYLRRSFELKGGIVAARLYATALGLYEARLNGRAVGDQVFAPGWTAYDQRLRYQSYDVTELVRPRSNAIGAVLGDGWYRGRLGFEGGKRNIWGDRLAFLAQLEVVYADGSSDEIVTDDGWRASTGPLLMSSIYDGETYDARLERRGWDEAGFDDAAWKGVGRLDRSTETLCAPQGPPVRRIETIQPLSIARSAAGKTLVDFGQNLVGRLSIRVRGPAGTTITLRHAEVLEHGELGTRPLRLAEATDRYILRGGEEEPWEPRFTYHGFRYAEVGGWPGELRPEHICAVVLHSDLERSGWFECSDPLLTRLHENAVWSMRGNFFDVPTDCPQRDERLGWTGDLQVFSPSACFIYDASGFLQSWLADLALEQRKLGGSVPPFVPNALGETLGAAAWADAATIVPTVLYQRYGDPGILADQFESMRSWVDHVASSIGDKFPWESGFQFGDWLDPAAPPDKPWQARTDKSIVATAYLAHSVELVARAAAILGLGPEEERYSALTAKAKEAFAREYVTPAGRMMCDAETAYALAIAFDLLPSPEQRKRAGDRLAELVRDAGYHIRTGFVGAPPLCDALCATGHHRAAYRILLQRECPSWLYAVALGATTIWERWDSMLPDGSINPGEMTSFNHYAFGAVADWMQRTIRGLAPAAPGYRRLEICPRPGGGLAWARVRHLTPYGSAECAWEIKDCTFDLTIAVPPNATALVTLPGAAAGTAPSIEVGSGAWHWSLPYADPDTRGPYTVDEPAGEIISDPLARAAVLAVLERAEAPGFLKAVLFNEPNNSLRQALQMLPNHAEAVEMMIRALEAL